MECKETREICDGLKKLNAVVSVISGGSIFQSEGLPDRFISHSKWSGWIEFKGSGTRITELQTYTIREWRIRGQNAVVVRFPNRIEDHNGELLSEFDGTARGLLTRLNVHLNK